MVEVVNGKVRSWRERAAATLLRGQPVDIITNVVQDVIATLSDEQKRRLAVKVMPRGTHVHNNPPKGVPKRRREESHVE